MRDNLKLVCILTVLLVTPLVSSCAPQEETEVEAEVEDLGEAMEEAADEYGEEMEELGEEMEEGMEEYGEDRRTSWEARPEHIPSFPWPPPQPTTRTVLDRALLAGDAATLGTVADRLTAALRRAGYAEHSFYAAPGGFALATRLEQIEFDGTPKPEPARWSMALPPRQLFSLADFVRALFTAPAGHYRVTVFIVNDRPFAPTEERVSRDEALSWLHAGLNRLPNRISELPFNDRHACTALVYQFRKLAHEGEPIANPDGAAAASLQLTRSGILAALGQ